MQGEDQTTDPISAKTVMGYVLEETRSAFLDRDFERFATFFTHPHEIKTAEGTALVADSQMQRKSFEKVVADRAARGVIDLHLRTSEAQYIHEKLIVGRFVCREVLKDLTFGVELQAHVCLRQDRGQWKFAEQTYVTGSVTIARAFHPK